MAQQQPIRREPAGGQEIPDKLYFRIGEVSRLCDIPSYVLRFWESEFPQLKPHKGGTGQRLYRRRDVETAIQIKTLLYDEGYTIPGARQVLRSVMKHKATPLPLALDAQVEAGPVRKLQKEMRELLAMLSKPPARPTVHTLRPVRGARQPRTENGANLFDTEPL